MVILAIGSFASLGAAYMFHRTLALEAENRRILISMLSLHFERDYAKLGEETYLQLGSLERRSKLYQDLLGKSGHVTVAFVPAEKSAPAPDKEDIQDSLGEVWTHPNPNEDHLEFPLAFGDLLLGQFQVVVSWTKSSLILAQSIASAIAFALLALLGALGGVNAWKHFKVSRRHLPR